MTNTLYYGDNLKVLRDYEEVKIPSAHDAFKKAGRVKKEEGSQGELENSVKYGPSTLSVPNTRNVLAH